MVESLYKRKAKWEEADNYTKLVSKYGRLSNSKKKTESKLIEKLKKRKAQQTEDHNLLEVIKTKYPKEFDICLKEYLENQEEKF